MFLLYVIWTLIALGADILSVELLFTQSLTDECKVLENENVDCDQKKQQQIFSIWLLNCAVYQGKHRFIWCPKNTLHCKMKEENKRNKKFQSITIFAASSKSADPEQTSMASCPAVAPESVGHCLLLVFPENKQE